ncbi:MAG: acetate--CoA ligase family protein [Gammaproteobacteria bacterium]|nr:acetate--CoA ligase family protein [Gammaproteobacteria bacterium]
MSRTNLKRLISPKTIAVFGSRGADCAIRETQKMGFKGKIWAVHPHRETLGGLNCFKSVQDLPGAPDAAFVAVNADAAIEIVSHLSAIGAGGAVMYASGFGEVGEKGDDRTKRLIEAAGDMPIIGPNCYGIINNLDSVALWPDLHGCRAVDKGVAIITQSGNIGLNMTMQTIGLDIAYMFTLGNQVVTDIADVMGAMLDDDRVSAIGLHIEGIHDIEAFDAVARRAISKKIPIVAIKSGRTEAAARIALSHTSSLTGADQLFDVYFERLGVARVDTVPEFLETLKLLSIIGPLDHNGVASMSCSGGEAGMMADLIDGLDICFPSLEKSHKASVKSTLNDYVEVSNPLDYHTFVWGNRAQTAACFSAMMEADYAATMLLLDWPKTEQASQLEWDTTMLALADAMEATNNKGIVLASISDCMPQRIIDQCLNLNIAPMIGMDICLKALNHAYRCAKVFASGAPVPIQLLNRVGDQQAKGLVLNEFVAKQKLANYGLLVPSGQCVSTSASAIEAAETLGYPVTAKILSKSISHKSEHNGVRLNIVDSQSLEVAVHELFEIESSLLIESMIQDTVVELIVGVNTDPLFGNYLVLGCGGVLVELLDDAAPMLMPVSRQDIARDLAKLNIYPILEGYRGGVAGDIEAIIDSVMAVVDFIEAHQVEELDINPLLVLEKGKGAVAVDALVKLKQTVL